MKRLKLVVVVVFGSGVSIIAKLNPLDDETENCS